MKIEPPEIEDLGQHQKSFEQQPITTKELELLNHQIEKTIGKESALLNEIIEEKSKNPSNAEDDTALKV